MMSHRYQRHHEHHNSHRLGWLRASVLGANDGIVSVSSLVLGVAAGQADAKSVMLAGIAGLVAGALSMAAGEYVSVSSQSDTERADLEMEQREIEAHPEAEHAELKGIYIERGLDEPLAAQVASALMAHDALGAHARDELGLSDNTAARPLQAALASAASFVVGAAVPLIVVLVVSRAAVLPAVSISVLLALMVLGALSARAGGAPMLKSVARVTLWGAIAMGVTSVAGLLFGVAV
ncbi:VIT family protein [Salinisphaera sp. LB1]|uniref:VIT1/CCC1 transporter family protein n=1 Tax=Salinisphaera sp. LB1 TaxID=2183911 RepID=UPI000D7D72F5|nr:nodulin 21-related protein [Salinisphaera sp. LB1]